MRNEQCVYVLIYKNWQEHYMFTECRGVYSTKELAEEAAKSLGLNSEYKIEKFSLDEILSHPFDIVRLATDYLD